MFESQFERLYSRTRVDREEHDRNRVGEMRQSPPTKQTTRAKTNLLPSHDILQTMGIERSISGDLYEMQPLKTASRLDAGKGSVDLMKETYVPSANVGEDTSTMLHYMQSKPSWMGDDTLSSTDVFHKRLNRQVVAIQARVRGMIQRKKFRQECFNRLMQALHELEFRSASAIQAQVRGRKQRQNYALCRAAIPMQAAFRGWVCRLKLQVKKLQQRLDAVAARHANELLEIEEHKQRELQRMAKEFKESAAKAQKAYEDQKEEIDHLIQDLRDNNSRLRAQNESLLQSNLTTAKKNEETMKLTLKIHENIQEVERALPKIQADHENLIALNREFERHIKQYQEALAHSQEGWDAEKKISKMVVQSIGSVVQRMEDGNAKNPSNKALADVMNKTAVRNIRIAMKQHDKSKKMVRDHGCDGASKQ
jgi:IQ calmodulin-binding motif